jgi:ATP-binding cassette subfamily D (ALD) long-chain fatty acid import protein
MKNSSKTALAVSIIPLLVYFARTRKPAKKATTDDERVYRIEKVLKVGVDANFFKQLKYILKYCVPRWKSRTVGILALHTIFLVLRTYMTVVVARIDGMLVKELVAGQGHKFLKTLGVFMAMALPATFTNSMVIYNCFYIIELILSMINSTTALTITNNR